MLTDRTTSRLLRGSRCTDSPGPSSSTCPSLSQYVAGVGWPDVVQFNARSLPSATITRLPEWITATGACDISEHEEA